MDVSTVLVRLMKDYGSLPAVKLAWNCHLNLCDPKEIPKIFPSHFLRELEYTSEERHALLAEQHKSMKFSSHGFRISVEPSILAFQKYQGGDKIGAKITVRNIDKSIQKISFRMNATGPFIIDENSRQVGRFASGLVTSVGVIFKPEDSNDYYHKLIIGINELRIAIPVVGIGSRGVLDFPDKINFGQVPVNYENSRLFPVLNIGTKPVKFIISTNAPFAVSPEKGFVVPNNSINLMLSFNSTSVGVASGFICVKYHTGEEIHVELEAEAINEDITYSPMDIEFQDTFVGMCSTGKVTVRNNTGHKIKFQWKSHPSAVSYFESNTSSLDAHAHKVMRDGSGDHGDNKKRLYSRGDSLGINQIITSEKDPGKVQSDKREPLYTDEAFRIEPLIGEIQPKSSIDVIVFFNPCRCGILFSDAFCQIDGLAARAEIRLIGKGLGVKFQLGFDVLDVGSVCLGGGHTYEISVKNTSQVEGTIGFDGFVGMMPGQFDMNPKSITLSPGEFSAFFLYYNAQGKPGEIVEDVRFMVKGTKEIMSIMFKGETVHPEIRYSETVLQFDEVSYGFPEKRQIVIMNDSLIPLNIVISVESDGADHVLDAEGIMKSLQDPDFIFPVEPQEFDVDPPQFTLAPRGFQRLIVTMTAASYGDYRRDLVVRLGGDTEVLSSLPLEAKCLMPTLIKPKQPIVVNCVTGYPCGGSFDIHNPSSLSAVYCCVPVITEGVLLTSDMFVGIIKARDSTTIKFNATVKRKGTTDAIIEFFIAGKLDPIMDLVVSCIAVSAGGAISVDRKNVDMGKVKVRVKATETVKIINTATVPIPFNLSMVRGGGMGEVWTLEPTLGTAAPMATTLVDISVTLNETGVTAGRFRLHVPGAPETSDIEVTVLGIGCALVFSPELDESGLLDFGYIFTRSPKILSFDVTNPGLLTKHLEWKLRNEEPPENPEIYIGTQKKKKELDALLPKKTPKSKRTSTVFEIVPMKKILKGGETFTMTIKANSNIPQITEIEFALWAYAEIPEKPDRDFQRRISKASIGQHTGRKANLNAQDKVYLPTAAQIVKVIAEFAIPKLRFSEHRIDFEICPNPTDYSNIFQEIVSLIAENPCDAELAVILHTASPFGIVFDGVTVDEWKHTFGPKEVVDLHIIFDISSLPKDAGETRFSGTLDCIYEKHPASDESIELTGELKFPTVTLERDLIDFGEVYNGQEPVQEFMVTNPGKFCITYKVYIVVDSVVMNVVKADSVDASKDAHLLEQDLLYTSDDLDMFEQERLHLGDKPEAIREQAESAFHCTRIAEGPVDEDLLDCAEYQTSTRYFYEKYYRMKLMSVLALRDNTMEPNDELTYFHYYDEKPLTLVGVLATPSEVMDIIPANGVIQAGRSQKLTVVFYAQADIHFEAKICIGVENGASKFFKVRGKSVPPPDPFAFLNTFGTL